MKKLLCVLLCAALFLPALTQYGAAAPASEPEARETLEDGSYFVTVLSDAPPSYNEITDEGGFFALVNRMIQFLRQVILLLRGTRTISKTKYVNYYDSGGTLLWTVSLTADFTCNKQKATCTAAYARHEVFDRDWSVVKTQVEKAGDTANGFFSVRQTKLGVPLKTIDRTVTITCDINGNVY